MYKVCVEKNKHLPTAGSASLASLDMHSTESSVILIWIFGTRGHHNRVVENILYYRCNWYNSVIYIGRYILISYFIFLNTMRGVIYLWPRVILRNTWLRVLWAFISTVEMFLAAQLLVSVILTLLFSKNYYEVLQFFLWVTYINQLQYNFY